MKHTHTHTKLLTFEISHFCRLKSYLLFSYVNDNDSDDYPNIIHDIDALS